MKETIYKALCACFALSPDSEEAAGTIREAYQEPENSPQPPREQNVIYYHLEPSPEAEMAPPYQEIHSSYPEYYWFPEYLLHVTCYGKDAEEVAEQIRIFIYLPGAGNPKSILNKAGIYLTPNTRAPVLTYEPVASRWRKRADVTIHLRVDKKGTYTQKQNMIQSPPLVEIIKHLDLFSGQPDFSLSS